MNDSIVVVEDGDDTYVRCERCGLSCYVPTHLHAKSMDDFYRHHRRDVPLHLHATRCPSWSDRTAVSN